PYYQNLLPVAENRFDESLKNMQGLEQPQVQMEQTTKGVRLTFETDEGEVYYTLDGTIPSEENRYTEPVELKKAGTYVVTAVSAADGSISSAYEIFPVRIAGGKITFSSAKNVSGKKIVVSYKSSKACTGYEFSFASKKDFSDQKTKLVKKKTIQISGLKKGKTYYVRVRGYRIDVYGNHYYTPYSKTKKITVKK
ncbi:MAG: chitobiase/beta-hexosaminidase C-terminal domain-containing protein, partial [Eubacterium sp.]|nr:chitobiase/beta-hexosaminidase C-terminal domain-containing protein [Eubacterium sp.]